MALSLRFRCYFSLIFYLTNAKWRDSIALLVLGEFNECITKCERWFFCFVFCFDFSAGLSVWILWGAEISYLGFFIWSLNYYWFQLLLLGFAQRNVITLLFISAFNFQTGRISKKKLGMNAIRDPGHMVFRFNLFEDGPIHSWNSMI